MVNAMLAQPDEHKRKKNPQQLASELQGMFFAAAGDGDTITVTIIACALDPSS